MKGLQFIAFKIIFLFASSFGIYAQQLPPILKYPTSAYNAGNQNWMISQDKNHCMYFANNEGLLEFNGANWNLYPSPNETIIRSVKVVGDYIYTGCYMEFGFWSKEPNNKLTYTSLSKRIKNKIIDDEQFWNILRYEQWVIFQSLNQIYIYDTKSTKISVIASKNGILKSFQVNNSIYYQILNEGLFEIEKGKPKLVSNAEVFKKNKIVNIFSTENGLLIKTQFSGFYNLNSGTVSIFKTEVDNETALNSVFSSIKLANGNFAIGTVSNGVFIINSSGKKILHLTQNNGLSNNTALSLYEDIDNNLWVGLDNGINCINLNSSITSFVDETGILGTVYASILFKNKIYVGTNQGLFFKDNLNDKNFQFIKGTKGQVWALQAHDNNLFCGHDSGTFIINNSNAELIFSGSGTWKFQVIANKPNCLLQGNYFGVSVLEKVNSKWKFRNKVQGFDYSSKHFAVTENLEVYISHEYKGIFRFQLDNSLLKASNFFAYKTPTKGKNASLTTYQSNVYYANKSGVYKLNYQNKAFKKDNKLSLVFNNNQYTSGKLIADDSNKLWMFSKNYIHYFTSNKLTNELKESIIPIPASISNSMQGYENITKLSNVNYLIGTTDGYFTINLNDLQFKNYNVVINNISVNKLDDPANFFAINNNGDFQHNQNNIVFNYSVPEYNRYLDAEYQYILQGLHDKWSEWSNKTTINFKNLPAGEYTFQVRAKVANYKPQNTASYSFTINKIWYCTNVAFLFYFIVFCIAFFYIHKTYINYYRNKEQKLIEENNLLLEIAALESNEQLMRLKNEQLSIDVDTKNKELAVSTMTLMKKNELLSLIKDDLKNTTDVGSKSFKTVISNITKNISEEDTWSVFKEAFDNADNNFLKNVKLKHNSLTPNDLRLCAYLRLNMSSKEIAPLLNISVRSVEIKRYRLRKKMDLPHEKGLVEYILAF